MTIKLTLNSLQTQEYAVKIKEFQELAAKQGVTPELRVSIEKEYPQ